MADSAIEWTNKVWNPVTGCSKVSEGCRNCYALREWARLSHNPKQPDYFGRGFTDVATHEHRLRQPLSYPDGTLCFVNSMSDLFHEKVDPQFIAKMFAVMAIANQVRFQALTKRGKNMLHLLGETGDAFRELVANFVDEIGSEISPCVGHLSDDLRAGEHWPLPNVWLGVSVEDADTFRERVLLLRQVPAAVRFISYEPALGPIGKWLDLLDCKCGDHKRQHENGVGRCRMPDNLTHGVQPCERYDGIDWVICGGESGPHARPMHPDWAREVRDACAKSGIAFFFKQWGDWLPFSQVGGHEQRDAVSKTTIAGKQTYFGACIEQGPQGPRTGTTPGISPEQINRVGKRTAGDRLDGVQHHEYPEVRA